MRAIVLWTLILSSSLASALTFPILKNSDIVGRVEHAVVQRGETMFDIARKFNLGLYELREANPTVKTQHPKAGTELLLPTQFILPVKPHDGIILNLAELRVYYFHPGQDLVSTHPVGIGRVGWKTPIGETKIIRKRKDPAWRPPNSIRRAYARKGRTLPDVVPPGPNNPLGQYAMNFGWPRFLMHGTNNPKSIGLRSSSGCVRMYPEDIEQMFHRTAVGTKVRVEHTAYKLGWRRGNLYLEAHDPFPEPYYQGDDEDKAIQSALELIDSRSFQTIDWAGTNFEIKNTLGFPIPIN